MPAKVVPQLAMLVDSVPTGSGWVHEMKFDGYRMLCRIEKGSARMISRRDLDWTAKFDSIASAAGQLAVKEAWLDGEVVVLGDDGRTSFQALQNALDLKDRSRLVYYAFDLLYLDGVDLRDATLLERKGLLKALLENAPAVIRYSEHFVTDGPTFFREACRLGLEGVIAKSADSTYFSGRGGSWVKVKCKKRQEVVVGGYTDPEGSRSAFGALHIGVYEPDGRLRYAGKVGTGFNERSLASVHERLKALEQDKAPFANPPRGAEVRRSHWVKPDLVAEVEFTEWTTDGTLRHPSFQGLRDDKKPRDAVREEAVDAPDKPVSSKRDPNKRGANSEDTVAGIKISNPEKLLYPDVGISKLELAKFYEEIGDWLVPHLEKRPLTLVRHQNGWQSKGFL
jgi:bifunctional non-homologous end joining protein LigD